MADMHTVEALLTPLLMPAAGFLVAVFALEALVVRLYGMCRERGRPLAVDPAIQARWDAATELGPLDAPRVLGFLERAVFYVAVLMHFEALVAAWLAFKLGSKWQVWEHVVRVPDKLLAFEDDLEYLRARHIWAQKLMAPFLVGTLANLLAAGAGVLVARLLGGPGSQDWASGRLAIFLLSAALAGNTQLGRPFGRAKSGASSRPGSEQEQTDRQPQTSDQQSAGNAASRAVQGEDEPGHSPEDALPGHATRAKAETPAAGR